MEGSPSDPCGCLEDVEAFIWKAVSGFLLIPDYSVLLLLSVAWSKEGACMCASIRLWRWSPWCHLNVCRCRAGYWRGLSSLTGLSVVLQWDHHWNLGAFSHSGQMLVASRQVWELVQLHPKWLAIQQLHVGWCPSQQFHPLPVCDWQGSLGTLHWFVSYAGVSFGGTSAVNFASSSTWDVQTDRVAPVVYSWTWFPDSGVCIGTSPVSPPGQSESEPSPWPAPTQPSSVLHWIHTPSIGRLLSA